MTQRYFGRGDTLRNASLEFSAGSKVFVESHFDNCTIAIGEGTLLTIGEPGVLTSCAVSGPGILFVDGQIFDGPRAGISGAARVVVSDKGSITGTVVQPPEKTIFAFQPGARLRLTITEKPQPAPKGKGS